MVLEEKLKDRIKREGPLTYEAFLDVVLYDEEGGYYRGGKRLRKDYYTSPEIHPVFGKTIGKYIEDIRVSCGRDRVTVIELGGGSGLLADQIVSAAAVLPAILITSSWSEGEKGNGSHSVGQ